MHVHHVDLVSYTKAEKNMSAFSNAWIFELASVLLCGFWDGIWLDFFFFKLDKHIQYIYLTQLNNVYYVLKAAVRPYARWLYVVDSHLPTTTLAIH